MKKLYWVVLLLMTTISSFAQNITYTTLYDNSAFNNKGISPSLAVGSTAGAANVSGTGAATYSIPIPVPPGTNGVVPSVSLEYSSQSGPGVAGMGWSISGLSMISRAPANTYFDGQSGPVELTTNDKFVLDGSRMILTNGTNATSGAQYATEVESFAKITAKGVTGNGPKFFEVVTKDGIKMEYGKSADSRFMDQAGNTVMFWRLNRVVQPDSNYVEFVYDNTDRDSRISEIRYTGNSATGQTPYNKITFSYKVRQTTGFSDIRTLYEGGSTIVSKYLLDKITVTAETQAFKTFQLSYGHDNVNSYLKSIAETGSDGTSLNPTAFKYGDLPTEVTAGNNVISGANIQAITGDFDGDGKREILSAHESVTSLDIPFFDSFTVYKSNGTGYSSIYTQSLPTPHTIVNRQEIPNSKSFIPGDFTGDGNDDVLTLNIANMGTYLRVDGVTIYKSVNGGTSFTPDVRQIQPNFNRIPASKQFFYAGDFDGDGVSEYISILGNSTGQYSPFLCINSVGGACGAITVSGAGLAASSWHTAGRITALDINADGRTDLMVEYGSQYEVFTIQGYGAIRIATGSLPAKSDLNFMGDFNGDGKTDLIFTDTEYKTITKFISTGSGFVSTPLVLTMSRPEAIAPTLQSQEDNFAIGDYNGDGKSDIHYNWGRRLVFPNPDPEMGNDLHLYFGTDIYYSQGDSFKYKQLTYTHDIQEGYGRPSIVPFVYDVPTDLNGDGKTDLVTYGPSSISYKLFNKDGRDNLLQKVSNGLNHVTEWNYKSLVEGDGFYLKGAAATFPVNTIQPPAILVYELKAANGLNGFSNNQYSYEGARLHRSGKGFLGFAKTTSLDLTMGLKTVVENEFNSTYYAAVPKKTTISQTTLGTIISETTMTNVFVTPGTKRFWVKTTGISENRSLEGATLTTTNVYDDLNGNVTSSTVVSPTETIAISTVYGAYPGSIPNKPTMITLTKTRTGQAAFTKATAFTYYPNGKVNTEVDFSGKAKAVTATYSYNNLGNLVTTTISATGLTSRSTTATFDSRGRYPEKTVDALSQESTAIYDPKWGQPTSVTGIDGLTTTNTFDGFGRTKTTTVNSDYVETNTLSWDIFENRIWKNATTYSQPGKSAVTQWFDQLGREVRTHTNAFDNSIIESNTAYDVKGNVASEEQPHKSGEAFITTTNGYDEYNRPNSIIRGALGNTSISYSYSSGNKIVQTSTPSGVSSKTTDLGGLTISATDNGGTLTYTYFSHGGLKEVKTGAVTNVSNQYDEYGRQIKLVDANAGTTEYTYNAFGELIWQKNALGKTYDLTYDVLGRIASRVGGAGTTTTETTTTEYYNAPADGTAKGKVKKVTGFAANNNTQYEYNNRGLVQKLTETIEGIAHITQYTYNVYGDILTTTYPSGLVVTNTYTANGYLQTISGAGATLYTTSSMNGQGQVTGYNKGKVGTQQQGKNSTISYANGFPTAYATPSVQDYQLVWDHQKGNLTSRKDARSSVNRTETFQYDNLNRLTSAIVGTGTAFTTTYQTNGNISTKKDLGAYQYNSPNFNAVTDFGNSEKAVSLARQDITYTAFNQPATISEDNYLLTYTYGADYNRIKSELKLGSTVKSTRYYFAGGFEKDVTGTTPLYIQYIAGPAGLVAIIESSGTTHTPHYTYTDHLGSILTVTNSTFSTIEAEQSFDAWGRRRNKTTWVLEPTQIATLPVWLIRGYTGHEHLDRFGLINMNGRLYDPATGRMLSPDNYVQEPYMTQSFNRYSYAMNNPLVYTDPDGNFWHIVIGAAVGGVLNLGVKFFQGRIDSFGDGLVAFGIGAAAGAVTAATGGAGAVYASTGTFAGAFSSSAVAAATTGIAGGAVAGATGAAAGGLIQGVGNAAYFGDPYSFKQWATGVLVGGITGGIAGGIAAKLQGKNIYNGNGTPDGPKALFPYNGLAKYEKINGTWSLKFNSAGDLTYQGVQQIDGTFGGSLANFSVGDAVGRGTNGTIGLLNQFNSAESLIQVASSTFGNVLKRGELQGFVRGSGPDILKSITLNAQKLPSGAFKLPNGTFIRGYNANSGNYTIQINTSLQVYKIRIIP